MVFVYAKIFVAARSRARKHVRKKQVGGSSVLEQKKTSSKISKPVPPQTSTSSQDNTAAFKQPVTTSASSTQQGDDKKEDNLNLESDSIRKSDSKGSIKAQANRMVHGRFNIRSQLNDQPENEDNEANVNQIDRSIEIQPQEQSASNLQAVSNLTTNTESGSSGIGTGEDHQINSVPTSGSSVQTEPASVDAKSTGFECAGSTSAFTYDHLFVEDRKSAPVSGQSESVGRPSTPSSKVTFSPNNIVFDLNANGTQSISMVPQIVIHGSMQQLHLQTNVKRARFSVNKIKDSDFNNNTNQSNEKRFGHPTITGTLSAGQLDCVILDQSSRDQSHSKGISTSSTENVQLKRSSIKRTKYQNELEIDCTVAQLLNQQQAVGSPHSILKPTSTNTSPTALNKNEHQIELQEKSITSSQHQPIQQTEANLTTSSTSNVNKDDKSKAVSVSNHVSPVSKTFSDQTANSAKIGLTQDGKLNYLGVNSLQSAASISGSMMSINYDYDSECYIDEKSSRRGLEDEFEFDDDENESSNTHDENASKRSVKSNLRHPQKGNIFSRWSCCKKWLWLNEKCAANQEEEFAGYEEDDEEEDEEFDQMGSSLRSTTGENSNKKGVGKRILRKNRNKSYNASIISANNTSSSGTHSGTAQQQTERKLGEKKSNSLFSRFSRDNSNKSTSSGSNKRTASSVATAKQQRASSAKSSCSVSAISQSSQTAKHRKHRHKTSSQLHAHSSSTTHSESGAATQYRFQQSDADRQRRRIAKAREKRATLILGLIMGAFILGN
ncbi:hypothetical protein [Candidatus Phytoplasma fabacearum]|uniref:hypothetical protein n=1 Tax=Candidatus Phytoplasma fabacearum TaxID=2982628 RepID=UPI002712D0F1|nr:hypothetical protein ['Bituminaria bituminosa' little leaf phytoplasma]MDO8030669.1 hypothetical protein ['Bituminaria bituminosa' little leaf phytoplasma]